MPTYPAMPLSFNPLAPSHPSAVDGLNDGELVASSCSGLQSGLGLGSGSGDEVAVIGRGSGETGSGERGVGTKEERTSTSTSTSTGRSRSRSRSRSTGKGTGSRGGSQDAKWFRVMNASAVLSICLLCLLLPTGCRSISSTPISRFDNNALAGNSNGQPRWFCNARPHKGVPVKLKVTTHCDVFIKERYCVELKDANAASATNKKPRLQLEEPLAASPLTFVESIPVQTDQVVLVDFKRPGSGSLNLDATFTLSLIHI
jgi:hypothetical protein